MSLLRYAILLKSGYLIFLTGATKPTKYYSILMEIRNVSKPIIIYYMLLNMSLTTNAI